MEYVKAAEQFIHEVWGRNDSDVILNQKTIDTIAAQMKEMGLSVENISPAGFHAGLQAARSRGLVELKPKPALAPAVLTPAPAPAQVVVEPEKKGTAAERLYQLGVTADGHESHVARATREKREDAEREQDRKAAVTNLESLRKKMNRPDPTVYYSDGRVNHGATAANKKKFGL